MSRSDLSLGRAEPLTPQWIAGEGPAGVAFFYDTREAEQKILAPLGPLSKMTSSKLLLFLNSPRPPAVVANTVVADTTLVVRNLDGWNAADIEHIATLVRDIAKDGKPIPRIVALSLLAPLTTEYVARFVDRATTLSLPVFFVDEHGSAHDLLTIPGGRPRRVRESKVAADLAHINAHRRRIGMAPLDTRGAGWTDEDVALEAQRLRREGNPRAALLAWT